MSDHEGEDSVPRGNEWEVVALTESTYAAAPAPKECLSENTLFEFENPETAHAMIVSGHFGSPSKQENLPQQGDLDIPQPKIEQSGKLGLKNEEDISMEGLVSDEFHGDKKPIEKDDNMTFYSSDFGDVINSKLIEKEQSIYDTGKSSSFNNNETMAGRSFMDEDSRITEPIESLNHPEDSEMSDVPKHIEEDDFDDLSRETWWRKHAASLYAQAKNVNPVWSIVVAAAVVGLVIIGYRWHRDKQHVMQLKPRLVIDDEGSRWILGPVTRLKDVTVGGQSSPYIRVLSAAQH